MKVENKDIIITDPCYLGKNIKKSMFTDYIWRDNLYGDWGCTTYVIEKSSVNKDPSDMKREDIKGAIGNFCADAGLVGVFLLDEVLKVNPEFDYHINKPHTTTLIKNFAGEIKDIEDDGSLHIKGVGNINFITFQTSL